MNKKGQTLALFVIIIPLIIVLAVGLIELMNVSYQKRHIDSFTRSFITNGLYKKEKDDIIVLYNDNKIKLDDINIVEGNTIEVSLQANIDSLMDIIKVNNKYDLKMIGYMENDKLKIKKG